MNKEERKAYMKEYYLDNKEKVKEYLKQYQLDNKEKLKEAAKQYVLDNKEKIKEYKKQLYLANKEKIKEDRKQYHLDNKEYFKKRNKEYRLANKESGKEYRKSYYNNVIKTGDYRVYTLPNANYYVGYTSIENHRMLLHKYNGKDTTDYEILHFCDTEKEAKWYEKFYHDLGFPGKYGCN